MSNIDKLQDVTVAVAKLQDAVTAAVARAVMDEGTALGIGDPIDRIMDAVIGLRTETKSDFVERYATANKALHENWTRRVISQQGTMLPPLEVDVDGRVVCADQCHVNPVMSTVCMHGTKGCVVKHLLSTTMLVVE
jgi:hypothetical protein